VLSKWKFFCWIKVKRERANNEKGTTSGLSQSLIYSIVRKWTASRTEYCIGVAAVVVSTAALCFAFGRKIMNNALNFKEAKDESEEEVVA
jgi:hypothetical protein